MKLLDRRRSAILLHPTSLPGPHGSGDLGPAAYHFVDWLQAAGQSGWQVLPLNPIGPGNSPYAGVSAFAGSPLLTALEPLIEQGWLTLDERPLSLFDAASVQFERVVPWRMTQLRRAFAGFCARADAAARAEFSDYCTAPAQADWLDDYALFMALDDAQRDRGAFLPWNEWDAGLAQREPDALAAARREHADAIRFWQFTQWCFDRQWSALKRYAHERGILLIGDLPIYVAHHSADCWAHPQLYRLDAQGAPKVVAGVPPDYFSATGQRWGNPLYDWEAMRRRGYAWWIARMRRQLQLADCVRIDHFRGFAGFWEIPASSPTAVEGRWVAGPGAEFFATLIAALGDLPLIAEDLGVITSDVEALRDRFAFPGMRVMQFAFGGDASNAFLPHNFVADCCAYSGTHDNDTTLGWWTTATQHERKFAAAYLDDAPLPWSMLQTLSSSVARLVIFPLQDVLGLGTEARLNTPGQTDCWRWRFAWTQVGDQGRRLARMSIAHGRATSGPSGIVM